MKTDDRPRNYRPGHVLKPMLRNREPINTASSPPVYSRLDESSRRTWRSGEGKRAAPTLYAACVRAANWHARDFPLEELFARSRAVIAACLMSSGLAAVTAPLPGVAWRRDHCLMVDSCYGRA